MTANTYTPAKWFRLLFVTATISLLLSLLNSLIDGGHWLPILQWALAAANIYFLFQLIPAHAQYGPAALLRTVSLVIQILASALVSVHLLSLRQNWDLVDYNALGRLPQLLNIATSVISIFATFFLYFTHSQFFAEKDPAVAKLWKIMMGLYLLALIIGTGGTSLITWIIVENQGSNLLLNTLHTLCAATGRIVSVLQVLLLLKSARVLEKAE